MISTQLLKFTCIPKILTKNISVDIYCLDIILAFSRTKFLKCLHLY